MLVVVVLVSRQMRKVRELLENERRLRRQACPGVALSRRLVERAGERIEKLRQTMRKPQGGRGSK